MDLFKNIKVRSLEQGTVREFGAYGLGTDA
jgi:hypothetical protein